jgi:gamma-glutamylcyclotransferase (GGCT)/AIG2-like uncharacterized protein YtfP
MDYIKEGDLIAVYGTLRKGERADLSRGQSHFQARYVGDDRIGGNIYNLGSYPGLKGAKDFDQTIDGNVCETVVVEVFKALDASLGTVLDYYEGWPSLYSRTQIVTEQGRKVWVYTYNGEVTSDNLIPSGDWTARNVGDKEAA